MKQIEIVIDDNPVYAKKVPLIELADLIKSLENLPQILNSAVGKSNDDFFKSLPALIHDFYPDVKKILIVATSAPESEINTWGIADLVIVAEAIYEVNNLKLLFDRAKKYKAQLTQKVPPNGNLPQSNGSPSQ